MRGEQGGSSLAKAHYNLANVFFSKGQIDDAIAHYRKALELQPGYCDAHINLGNALHRKRGMDREAIAQYEEALKIDPNSALALSQIAWLLATSSEEALRNGARAVESAEKADQLSAAEMRSFSMPWPPPMLRIENFPKQLKLHDALSLWRRLKEIPT